MHVTQVKFKFSRLSKLSSPVCKYPRAQKAVIANIIECIFHPNFFISSSERFIKLITFWAHPAIFLILKLVDPTRVIEYISWVKCRKKSHVHVMQTKVFLLDNWNLRYNISFYTTMNKYSNLRRLKRKHHTQNVFPVMSVFSSLNELQSVCNTCTIGIDCM